MEGLSWFLQAHLGPGCFVQAALGREEGLKYSLKQGPVCVGVQPLRDRNPSRQVCCGGSHTRQIVSGAWL